MERPEAAELDETAGQSAPLTTAIGTTQNQVRPNIQPGNSLDHSTDLVVESLVIGEPWTTGLFDCHEQPTNAIMACCCPCVTFGQIAEVLNDGEYSCLRGTFIYALLMPAACTQWFMGSKYRTKLRKKYNLVEAPYTDDISHLCCPCCSLCQEFRELKNRGRNPDLGWNGILAQRQAQKNQGRAPPANQVMSK
ncbi:protein PLANT CADMIUM RESISTANCE 8-like [Tripterygium wilfordii]|uniref:Protein PLANT CADMIUM RESISTANCE 8-like n=1 Tax=Tripterygium wilfordii TaxID=458696 RepID=A0A7J7D5W7_TRIWF|nr:protein PLANT CADMIUM RESISTANCE 8-like [Tripterygium wilfordii]KAF5741669.1 protein PLANT CADMIUM RESISTANCE 8-like [Tripterygium wilfordii]